MIHIKDISGKVKLSVEINEGSIRRFELMKEDYIQLKFSLVDPVYFSIGDYVEIEEEPFYITKLTYSSFNESTEGYDYELRFDSHYYRWGNHILFYDRQENKEATWSLTRSPEAHLGIVVSNIRSLGFKYKGKEYQAVVDSSVDPVAKLVQYENTNIIDALTKIAETWECEWWVEGDKIYLGRCEHGEPIDLEIGKELSSMTRSQSKETYANRIYAFGSTRNIPSNYRSNTSDGSVVEGVITKRLMLPVGIDHIDAIEGLKDSEVVDRVVVFDTVYPRTTCTITSVKPKDVTETPEGGEPETYKVYRFRDSNFHFSSKYILPTQELRIEFQSGPLAGMDFGVAFNPDKVGEDTEEGQVFEIARNQDYGQWLPAEPLIPTIGSQFILYGFDTKFVSDQLLGNAEQELLEKTQDFVKKLNIDPSTYNCTVNSYKASGHDEQSGVLFPSLAIDLKAGQKVNLINKAYFKNGRMSRLLGFEKKLDVPYDSPTYIVGETSSYSRVGELEKKIENIQFKGNTYVNQGGGGGVYVLKKEDTTAASDENVFSSLRTLYEINKAYINIGDMFLRKDINDTAHGFITFEKGFMTQAPIRSADYNLGWEAESPKGFCITETGTGWFKSLNVRGPILGNDVLGSPYFASGWTGFGTQLDFKTSSLELDNLIARKSIKAYQFIVNQVRGTNGSLSVTDTMEVETVEDRGDVWRCVIDDLEGEMYMMFRPGDIIRCQTWKKLTGKYYAGVVTAVGDDWFEVSKDLLDGTDGPAPHDTVYRWTNESDDDRKGLLYLTSSDSYSPYLDVRYGNWNATVGTIKARAGRLDGINDPYFPELYGSRNNFGLYTNNFYGTGELILRSTGESVSRTFEVLRDRMAMGFNELREEVYVSKDSILQNPTFSSGTMDFWETDHTDIYPYTFGGSILIANGTLFSNIIAGARIIQDELVKRNVLQVTSTVVRQRNADFNGREPGKYAISFSYRPVVNYGSLKVGIENSDLQVTVPLRDVSKWQRAEITGDWDGMGDFVIEAIGGGIANIVDISFADDRLENTISKIKVEYDTRFDLKADEAKLNSFRKEYDEFNKVVREDYATQTWTATKINSEVGTIINGKLANYSTIAQTSSAINAAVRDLNLGQYATTTWTSNQITSAVGDKVSKSEFQETKEGFTMLIQANAYVTNENTKITEAFYKFDNYSMKLNRRIELGSGSSTSFTAQSGISPNTDNVCFWAGGTYAQAQARTAKVVIGHDGSGFLAGGNFRWDTAGNVIYSTGTLGKRVYISPDDRYGSVIQFYDGNNLNVSIQGPSTTGAPPAIVLEDYSGSERLYSGSMRPDGCSFEYSRSSQVGLRLGIDIFGYASIVGNWYSQSNAPTGCVYEDSNGYLRVKLT